MGLNLEFLDVIDDRRDRVRACERPLIVHAIQHEQVASIRLAIH